MTVEEIRKHKEQAEEDIRRRLQAFKELTGMCPLQVSATAYESRALGLPIERHVGRVFIELEAI